MIKVILILIRQFIITFFDEDTSELIDCNEEHIDFINIKNNITGKKINSVEVLIKVASDNQNQN